MSDLGTEENEGVGDNRLIAGSDDVADASVNSASSVTIGETLPLRFEAPACCTRLPLDVAAGVIVVGSGGTGLRLDCGAGRVGGCSDGIGVMGVVVEGPIGGKLGTSLDGGNVEGANCGTG